MPFAYSAQRKRNRMENEPKVQCHCPEIQTGLCVNPVEIEHTRLCYARQLTQARAERDQFSASFMACAKERLQLREQKYTLERLAGELCDAWEDINAHQPGEGPSPLWRRFHGARLALIAALPKESL
jgi:hypothetical protein